MTNIDVSVDGDLYRCEDCATAIESEEPISTCVRCGGTFEHVPEPERPEGIAAYVLDGLERQDSETLRTIAHYAHAVADWLDALEARDLDEELVDEEAKVEDVEERPGEDLDDVPDGVSVNVYTMKVPCGDDSCTSCPHGPYRYAKWRDGKTVRSKYLGKA